MVLARMWKVMWKMMPLSYVYSYFPARAWIISQSTKATQHQLKEMPPSLLLKEALSTSSSNGKIVFSVCHFLSLPLPSPPPYMPHLTGQRTTRKKKEGSVEQEKPLHRLTSQLKFEGACGPDMSCNYREFWSSFLCADYFSLSVFPPPLGQPFI